MMDSRIFTCVRNNDVEGLKSFVNYKYLFQIEDAYSQTILQRAIWGNKIAVFDFLLSLDDYPINACNTKGETVLEIALRSCSSIFFRDEDEYFVNSLLKKGVDIKEYISLHRVLDYGNIKVVKLFIEQGADLNCYNQDGQTPLHRVNNLRGDTNEWLAMMLYFGADPSIPDREGYSLIDYAFEYRYNLSKSMEEHLLFHVFDDYGTDYDISVDTLFGLLQSDYSFVPHVLKHIISVKMDKNYGSFAKYFKTLFTIKPEYLKLLLEKFDYVIENIIDNMDDYSTSYYALSKEMFIENFDLLLKSQFASDVTQTINKKTRTCVFLAHARCFKIPKNEISETIMIMLSYGADIYYYELEEIYQIVGDCEFFRILLHIDTKQRNVDLYEFTHRSTVPYLLHNIHIDIKIFVSDLRKCNSYCSPGTMEELLNHFAHPKLKNYCHSRPRSCRRKIFRKVKNLPRVPLLVELARNKVRTFLVQKYR